MMVEQATKEDAAPSDGMEFTKVSDDKDKLNKKKEITCFKCKKVGHYASMCE